MTATYNAYLFTKKYTRESFQNGLVSLGRLAEALDVVEVVKRGRSGALKPGKQTWLELHWPINAATSGPRCSNYS